MSHEGRYFVVAAAQTHVGRVRRENEDSLLVADLGGGDILEENGNLSFTSGRGGSLFAVADGIGGAAGGGTASKLGLRTLLGELTASVPRLRDTGDESLQQVLMEAIGAANSAVFQAGRRDLDFEGMGTTLTAGLEMDGRLAVGHVGDSRAYLLSESGLRLLTQDQSLVAELVATGRLTEQEARRHRARNILLQALGVGPSIDLSLRCFAIRPGDVLLLCSDGLHGQVPDPVIYECVAGAPNLKEACSELVEAANEQGGRDNVTVVLAQFIP